MSQFFEKALKVWLESLFFVKDMEYIAKVFLQKIVGGESPKVLSLNHRFFEPKDCSHTFLQNLYDPILRKNQVKVVICF